MLLARLRSTKRQRRTDQKPECALVKHVARSRHHRKTGKAQNDERRRLIDGRTFPFFKKYMHERHRKYQKAHNTKLGQKPYGRGMNDKR